MRAEKRKYKLLFIIFIFLLFFLPNFYKNQEEALAEPFKQNKPQPSYQVLQTTPWLKNPTMDSPIEPIWFWKNGTEGDNSDVSATTSPGQANINILGETQNITLIYGTPNGINSPAWKIFNNSDFMLPDEAIINSSGCYVYHYLDEITGPGQVHNFPSVHFRKNVSMPVDMSDYVITDVSLEVSFNASVDINVDSYNDWNPLANTPYIDMDKFLIGDSANFYVELSDINHEYPYRVANFETRDVALGEGDLVDPDILNITDRELNYVDKADLIAAINSALETDKQNFTITLGLDIYCEDNKAGGGGDQDYWKYLIFKTCNLTISYVKKIDPFTTISWNQIGNKLNDTNIQIVDAEFNFKYKINQTWPSSAALSEIRFYINNKIYAEESIRLSSATTTFQEAKSGGFDVYGYIDKENNISVSIEVFLKDSFNLNETISISIDDVFLNISYLVSYPDIGTRLELFLNGDNKTLDPVLDIPINTILNITVKYSDYLGEHLSGADIKIKGDRLSENLNESIAFEQYSINVNGTEKLILGANILTIEAQFPNHETRTIYPRITLRKIQTNIQTVSGSSSISIQSGEDASLQIILNNTDFQEYVKGAIVTYTWEFGEGFLTDSDNDGIYESILENVPDGIHSITISAFAGEKYEIENYEIILNVVRTIGPDYSWLVFLLIGAMVGLGTIFGLYQTHFKYPPMIRKIRKLRKKIGKGRKLKPFLVNKREELIIKKIQDNIHIVRVEPIALEKSPEIDKIDKTEGLK